MTIALNRPYAGYAAGVNASFDTPTEAALVQQGFGTITANLPTAGAQTTTQPNGRAVIATGAGSVTITNPMVTPQSKISAFINQATADTGLTSIMRVVPALGSFTIYGNANAAAPVAVDWANQNLSGLTAVN